MGYTLSDRERETQLKNERERARIMRLKQVRRQDTAHAQQVRLRFKSQKVRLQRIAQEKVERQWQGSRKRSLHAKSREIEARLKSIGNAHRDADAFVLDAAQKATQDCAVMQDMTNVLLSRGRYALSLIDEKKKRDANSVQLRRIWREKAQRRAMEMRRRMNISERRRVHDLPHSLQPSFKFDKDCPKHPRRERQEWSTTRHYPEVYHGHSRAQRQQADPSFLKHKTMLESQTRAKKAYLRGQQAMRKQLLQKQRQMLEQAAETLQRMETCKKVQGVIRQQNRARENPAWFISQAYDVNGGDDGDGNLRDRESMDNKQNSTHKTANLSKNPPNTTWIRDQTALVRAFEKAMPGIANLDALDHAIKDRKLDEKMQRSPMQTSGTAPDHTQQSKESGEENDAGTTGEGDQVEEVDGLVLEDSTSEAGKIQNDQSEKSSSSHQEAEASATAHLTSRTDQEQDAAPKVLEEPNQVVKTTEPPQFAFISMPENKQAANVQPPQEPSETGSISLLSAIPPADEDQEPPTLPPPPRPTPWTPHSRLSEYETMFEEDTKESVASGVTDQLEVVLARAQLQLDKMESLAGDEAIYVETIEPNHMTPIPNDDVYERIEGALLDLEDEGMRILKRTNDLSKAMGAR